MGSTDDTTKELLEQSVLGNVTTLFLLLGNTQDFISSL